MNRHFRTFLLAGLTAAGLTFGPVALAQPAAPSGNLQGDDQASWIADPHMHAFYQATRAAFAHGPAKVDVAAFEQSLKDGSAKILFYNSQVTDETTARLLDLAKASKVPVIGVTETEPAGQTIQTWFAAQIAAVQRALGQN